jgi:hypothetical protein
MNIGQLLDIGRNAARARPRATAGLGPAKHSLKMAQPLLPFKRSPASSAGAAPRGSTQTGINADETSPLLVMRGGKSRAPRLRRGVNSA